PPSQNFVAVAGAVEIAYSHAGVPLSWTLGTINQSAFTESFRAVTPLGANGFAACGIGGDIRVSTDNGVHWNISHLYVTTGPELLGIASDNTNRIVAVGAGGTLLYSPDAGATWSSHNPTGNNLNAVAFSFGENLFLAVGD